MSAMAANEEADLRVEGPLLAESLSEDLIAPSSARHGGGERRRLGLVAALVGGVGLVGLAGTRLRSVRGVYGSALAATELAALEEASKVCTPEGGNCAETQCCLAGGEHGLQCFAKNKFYATCLQETTCEKGVHDGEKHGTYDQSGTLQLDQWSCEKLGERSEKGCQNFKEEGDCPASRCEWFRTGQCLQKCSVFTSGEACPSTHCVWEGGKCGADPCSAKYNEDCRITKCCSATRGAAGSQCFAKNEFWATCQESCNNVTNKGWKCDKIGERRKIPAPCSWAGKDCSQTHCCGNQGFSCARKDDAYAGCVMTNKKTTWFDEKVPLPDGWEGTILGGWSGEHAIEPAGPDAAVAGTSLFCFMAVLPDSPEVALMEVAKKKSMGVFACNASAIFDSWVSSSEGWDTGEATLVNTAVFFKVWDQVREDGRYRDHDWTVKADADAAFLPDRLRTHLVGLRPPAGEAIYLKNTNQDVGLSNGQFLGAIEIFSLPAVQLYFDNAEDCQKSLGDDSGEDGFFKGCMDGLGVYNMHDGHVLKPDFAAVYCSHESQVAFHPLKDPAVLENCYNIVLGKPCDFEHNLAPGAGY